jgi:hypothetical protein
MRLLEVKPARSRERLESAVSRNMRVTRNTAMKGSSHANSLRIPHAEMFALRVLGYGAVVMDVVQ